jgi:cell shape-determining protein MreC
MSNGMNNNLRDSDGDSELELLENSPAAQFAKITTRLTQLIAQENQLLENRQIAETRSLQAEKARLAKEYQNLTETLQMNSSALGREDAPARVLIRQLTEKFQKELKKHGRILLRMKTIAEGMIKSISDEADHQGGRVRQYTPQAAIYAAVNSKPVPIAYHEVI